MKIDFSHYHPLGMRVIVKPDVVTKTSKGGILIPYQPSHSGDCRSGVIVALGPNADGFEKGDRVLYHQDQEQKFLSDREHDEDPHYIMDAVLIDALLEEDCRIE